MTKATTLAVVTAVLILAVGVGARIFAQDVRGPELKVHTTLYTSPVQVGGGSCNVLNVSNKALEVEIRLVYQSDFFFDQQTQFSVETIAPKHSAILPRPEIDSSSNARVYCKFSFNGQADQVRAALLDLSGGALSEAR